LELEVKMPSCEQCWRDAGGDANRYAELVKQRRCTPEEQAAKVSKGETWKLNT